jgi:glutamyl-tRNA(Gln) amidotransferase subunit E
MRQAILIEIQEELKKREVNSEDLTKDIIDASSLFEMTKSKILLNALKSDGKIYAVKLKGFNGLLGKELCPNRRLGTEMSDHAKFTGGVKGIFNTDELPGYQITPFEVDRLKDLLRARSEDAIVIVAGTKSKCIAALTAVVDRAIQALDGVPAETRSANPDGTTRFTRPRPGAARMYPETDVKPTKVTKKKIEALLDRLPLMPEVKLANFMKKYELNEKLAIQLLDSDRLEIFEELSMEGLPSTLLAVTLTEDLTKIRRDGVPVENLTNDAIRSTFSLLREGQIVKESVVDLLVYLSKNPSYSIDHAVKILGFEMMDENEVKQIVDSTLAEKADMVKQRGMKSIGPLMGIIMGKVRGKASPQKVNKLLNVAIKALIEGS